MTRIDKNSQLVKSQSVKSQWLEHRLDMQDRLQSGGVWSPEQ